MFSPSDEQRAVHDQIKRGVNVVVDACAGSGKSTTVLGLAAAMPRTKFLHVTYNSMLRKEFQEKVRELRLTNLEVHTFHSLCVRYFTTQGSTDAGLRAVLQDRMPMAIPSPPSYRIVVLDEVQDMTPLYFHFIRYFLRQIAPESDPYLESDPDPEADSKKGSSRPSLFQLLLLGDCRQGLYEFKGSDVRFLTHAHRIWRGFPLLKKPTAFVQCTLRMSYRITRPMASFVNEALLGEPCLQACRDGVPVVYLRNSRANLERIVTYHIRQILNEGDAPGDIFVLGASVKGSNSMVRRIENALVEANIPCHVPRADDTAGADRIDERVIQGKVVFSTFHTVKGRQRKYVFVTGFDQSYFTYFCRNAPVPVPDSSLTPVTTPTPTPNTLYVATTRATHRLFVLETNHHATDRPLACLRLTHHQLVQAPYVDFKGTPQAIFYEPDAAATAERVKRAHLHYLTPSELIRFVPETVLDALTPTLMRLFVTRRPAATTPIDLPSVVQFGGSSGLYEDVSDINGVAIPNLWWEHARATVATDPAGSPQHQPVQTSDLYASIEQSLQDMRPHEHAYLRKLFLTLSPTCHTPSEFLYMSNVYLACQDKLYGKLKQIPRDAYQWVSDEAAEACRQTLDQVVGVEGVQHVEYTLIQTKADDVHAEMDRRLEACLTPESNTGATDPAATEAQAPKYRFHARVDMVTQTSIWEIKCTQQLTVEHMLQVVIYAWIAWTRLTPATESMRDKRMQLLNIKTGEVLELCASVDELTPIVAELIRAKYRTEKSLNEEEFVASCTVVS